MKAYAIQFDGVFFIVFDETAARAKGQVIEQANNVSQGWMRQRFRSLGCRRWSDLDDPESARRVVQWGTPGERDYETGTYIGTPDPWVSR